MIHALRSGSSTLIERVARALEAGSAGFQKVSRLRGPFSGVALEIDSQWGRLGKGLRMRSRPRRRKL